MKKYILISGALLSMMSCAAENKDVTVTLPAGGPDTIVVHHDLVSDMLNARRRTDLRTVSDTVTSTDGKFTFSLDPKGAAHYMLEISDENVADFYAAPGESINVAVETLSPIEYSVSGSQLTEDITALEKLTAPLDKEYATMASSGQQPTEAQMKDLMDRYDSTLASFISKNPDSPAVAYVLLNMRGEQFLNAYANMTSKAKESILMPFVERQAESARVALETEKKREAMLNGTTEAPAFTLKDLQGKDVSLSQFRGKWVILDFWGSWCGWCIKGMPKLKEAYKEYAGKVEVIGIDCNEPEQAWREGVAKYELPWINVYNPKDSGLLEKYLVEGFPTKVIVSPEGKIADITVGEDPSFYSKLSRLVNGGAPAAAN